MSHVGGYERMDRTPKAACHSGVYFGFIIKA